MTEQRTDEEIQRLSELAFRHETNPETERLRMLQAAREEIRRACVTLADPYDHLHDGLWVDEHLTLADLVDNIVSDLLIERGNVQRMRSLLESANLSSAQHSEEAQRNLRRAVVAERRLEACEAQRTHEANVYRGRIKQLENDLRAADDLLASYRAYHAAMKGGE